MDAALRRLAFAAAALGTAAMPAGASTYDAAVLADHPVLYLGMGTPAAGTETDLSGHGLNGTYLGGAPKTAALPDGEPAADFNGAGQYLTVPAAPALSAPAARALTIESWIKPDTLQFPHSEGEGYVYWLGKGDPSAGYEYANRMYSLSNTANRPNRISDYAWNVTGGLGSGAYFQDPVATMDWILVTDVIDMNAGTIAIYKNGVLRERVPLSQYSVTPATTKAPFNVGTRSQTSWFAGAVGKVAVYGYVLSDARIAAHYAAMTAPASASAPPPAPAVISNVAAANITSSGANITWNTTTVSHSQVEYGLTTAYGSKSYRSTATGTYHSIPLSSLKAWTVYHYRVLSLDSATGQTAASGDYTFKTL